MESVATAALLLGLAAPAAGSSMQLVVPLAGDVERRVIQYQCEGVEQNFAVEYVNAQPNFLAIVPVEGKQTIFVTVLSASGARYVSGVYEWWTSGTDATFTDVREDPPAPVNCTEVSETP